MAQNCFYCGAKLSFRNSFVWDKKPTCRDCLRKLDPQQKQTYDEQKPEYSNKRFLSERVLFIATSGILPALFAHIPQLLFGVPLFILLFYVPAYILFRVGSLTVTFEGEIPDWAKSKFSWKRFGMEYLYFFGILAAGSLAIILYRLVTGQI